MAWNLIGNFLEKFSSLKLTKDFYGDEISEVIKDVLNININPQDINYKNGVILIKIKNPVIRNEIFMNKDKILKAFPQKIQFKKLKPIEIRF